MLKVLTLLAEFVVSSGGVIDNAGVVLHVQYIWAVQNYHAILGVLSPPLISHFYFTPDSNA